MGNNVWLDRLTINWLTLNHFDSFVDSGGQPATKEIGISLPR
jgi:hypothetical protein